MNDTTELGHLSVHDDEEKNQRIKFINSDAIVEDHDKRWIIVVPPNVKYVILATIVGGTLIVFFTMLVYFLKQTTHVLVDQNQQSQCVSSSQIFSFAPVKLVTYFPM